MIPKDFITEWRAHAPWVTDRQVEQDLVIPRALVELFSREPIANALAFRGGTALYKLHLRPAARYSEDIDLVQTVPGELFQPAATTTSPRVTGRRGLPAGAGAASVVIRTRSGADVFRHPGGPLCGGRRSRALAPGGGQDAHRTHRVARRDPSVRPGRKEGARCSCESSSTDSLSRTSDSP